MSIALDPRLPPKVIHPALKLHPNHLWRAQDTPPSALDNAQNILREDRGIILDFFPAESFNSIAECFSLPLLL